MQAVVSVWGATLGLLLIPLAATAVLGLLTVAVLRIKPVRRLWHRWQDHVEELPTPKDLD